MNAIPTDGESQTAFAKRVGLSQPRISQMVKEGLPTHPTGSINVAAALQWMQRNLDPERRERSTINNAARTKSVRVATAQTEVAEIVRDRTQDGPTAAEIRKQGDLVRVARSRLAFDKEKGKLIDRTLVRNAVFERLRRQRNAHESWVLKIAPVLAGKYGIDPSELFATLNSMMRDHLEELACLPTIGLPE